MLNSDWLEACEVACPSNGGLTKRQRQVLTVIETHEHLLRQKL